MALISRATLPSEFFDRTSAMMLVQPEPQYLYAQLVFMADLQAELRANPDAFELIAGRGVSGGLFAVILVMTMTQFATHAVGPVVTLYVQEMLGSRPDIATLGGVAYAATGLAGVLAVPILGKRGDTWGYKRVLMLSLAGAALFTQAIAREGKPAAERFLSLLSPLTSPTTLLSTDDLAPMT